MTSAEYLDPKRFPQTTQRGLSLREQILLDTHRLNSKDWEEQGKERIKAELLEKEKAWPTLLTWAVEIVQKHFSDGLARLCDPDFLAKRYTQFKRRDDPVYVELLTAMKEEALAKTFVSYWTIAQTLATQSRFWLEDAVADIILMEVRRFGRRATHVYSQKMLSDGYLERQVAVAELGEHSREHLMDRKPWRPLMKENALREVDVLVGEQERERVSIEYRQQVGLRRTWDEARNGKAAKVDQEQLNRIAQAVGGRRTSDVAIQCNLLVVDVQEDDKPQVFAFRFVNPNTISSHAKRKQERVNLLRLYAYLVQEKPFRNPTTIHVRVAELLPRLESDFNRYDYYPDYFSPHTYWDSNRLWDFIGVPFWVVSQAIRNVGQEFRERLNDGLRSLLPGARSPIEDANKGNSPHTPDATLLHRGLEPAG
jgi:hypothetical protein